jgi:hypothetical protein
MKLLRELNFNFDTVRIGRGIRATLIEIETDYGNCTDSETLSVDSAEGIIIKKTKYGDIVLGVQDEEGA